MTQQQRTYHGLFDDIQQLTGNLYHLGEGTNETCDLQHEPTTQMTVLI